MYFYFINIKWNFWRKRKIGYDTNIQNNEESKRQFDITINQLNQYQYQQKIIEDFNKIKEENKSFHEEIIKQLKNYQEEEKERCGYYNSNI